jgi:hypothetical protein
MMMWMERQARIQPTTDLATAVADADFITEVSCLVSKPVQRFYCLWGIVIRWPLGWLRVRALTNPREIIVNMLQAG